MESVTSVNNPIRAVAGEKEKRLTYASFRLGKSELALSISSLQEVVNLPPNVVTVPLAPKYLVGLFNLRGVVIPIINLREILNIRDQVHGDEPKVAIIEHEGVRVGLLFDSTAEILNVDPRDVSEFEVHQGELTDVIKGAIKLDDGNRILQVIDPREVIKIRNVPHLLEHTQSKASDLARRRAKRLQCITFRIGKIHFAFNIAAIREIIRVPEIIKTAPMAPYDLGMVNLRGASIPLVDFRKFLELDGHEESQSVDDQSRIVILKIEEMRFGFLVESVDNIIAYADDEILPIPVFSEARVDLFQGMLTTDACGEVFFLDEGKVLSDKEIHTLTHGHSAVFGTSSQAADKSVKKSGARKAYLSFRLDFMLSVELREVDEIANVCPEIVHPPGYPDYVYGMMKRRGEAVTVIDMRLFYHMPKATVGPESKILIVKKDGIRYGLLVDAVDSIKMIDESDKVEIPSILATNAVSMEDDVKEMVETVDAHGETMPFMILDFERLLTRIASHFRAHHKH